MTTQSTLEALTAIEYDCIAEVSVTAINDDDIRGGQRKLFNRSYIVEYSFVIRGASYPHKDYFFFKDPEDHGVIEERLMDYISKAVCFGDWHKVDQKTALEQRSKLRIERTNPTEEMPHYRVLIEAAKPQMAGIYLRWNLDEDAKPEIIPSSEYRRVGSMVFRIYSPLC